MSEKEREAFFSRVRTNLLKHCSPLKIIIFGSYARGTQTASSDLDVALLFRTEEEAETAKKTVLSQPPLTGIATDYLFLTEQRYNERKNFGGACVSIAAEGVTIFEAAHDS